MQLSDPIHPWVTRIAWVTAFLALTALSWCIPLLSRQDPRSGTLSYPPLYPVYFQTNVDAPLEMRTCLGFPGHFREEPYRISRPTYYAALAGVREFMIDPVARLFVKGEGPQWGPWSARKTLITYFLWLFANVACVAGATLLGFRLLIAYLPGRLASLTAAMFLSTPILLLVMREIHLSAFQAFTTMACLAFWDAVLANRLSARWLVAASLLLGLFFLGKPNLNLFGAGIVLCLWLRQGRKLPVIVALAAMPTLIWICMVRAMGMAWSMSEVTQWKAGIWIVEVGPAQVVHEFAVYVMDWLRVLGESLTPAHLAFAAWGAWSLWKGRTPIAVRNRRALLALAGLLAGSDFLFYFLVHRVHAVYYVGTLLCVYALAVTGLTSAIGALSERWRPEMAARSRAGVAWATVIALQAYLLCRQLPHYPG